MSESKPIPPEDSMLASAMRCLDRALAAMNRSIEVTTTSGPAAGMEHVADFLNNTDGVDDATVARTPGDWLTRWSEPTP